MSAYQCSWAHECQPRVSSQDPRTHSCFVCTMVMLQWKLHSNHGSLLMLASTQSVGLEDLMQNRKMYIISIVETLVSMVLSVLGRNWLVLSWQVWKTIGNRNIYINLYGTYINFYSLFYFIYLISSPTTKCCVLFFFFWFPFTLLNQHHVDIFKGGIGTLSTISSSSSSTSSSQSRWRNQ